MVTPEMRAFAAVFASAPLQRIRERAARGAELYSWAVTLNDPPTGSSLELDDAGFLPGIGVDRPVAWYARFPVSSAAEHLAAIDVLVSDWLGSSAAQPPLLRSWPSSLLVLCRSAVESSARTIWLISEKDREVRRQRCAAEAAKELAEMLKWGKQNDAIDEAEGRGDAAMHEAAVAKQKTAIANAEAARGGVTLPGFAAMTEAGADWIKSNPPAHGRDLLGDQHFGLMMKAWYSIGSSFTHGYSWARHILVEEHEYYGLVADLIMCAVLMTETAAALFEAQMLAPGEEWRNEHLPERLRPTITEWAPRFRAEK